MAERLSKSACPNAWLATSHSNDVKLAHSSTALALAPRPSRHFPLTLFSLPSTIFLSLLTSTVSLCPAASYSRYRYLDQHCRLTRLKARSIIARSARRLSSDARHDRISGTTLCPAISKSSRRRLWAACCLRGPGRFAGYLPRLTGKARLGNLDSLRWRKRRDRRNYYFDRRIAASL
jgi:hypothetical protein